MALTKVIGDAIGTVANQFADANMSPDSIIQTVFSVDDSETTTTSTSYVTTGLTRTITLSATSSKVLIISNNNFYNGGAFLVLGSLFRGSTNLANANGLIQANTSGRGSMGFTQSMFTIDSPSSTSQLTYGTFFKINTGSTNGFSSINNGRDYLICMEIRG